MVRVTQQKNSRFTLNHLLVVGCALLAAGLVTINNRIATSGKELERLELQSLQLDEENQRILAHQVTTLSLTQLSSKAKELGFVQPETIINLSSEQPLASLPNRP